MGKSKAPTEQTVTQTNLPDYAEPYFTRLLERTEAQSLAPYEAYPGQRIADLPSDITAAYDVTRDVAGSGIAGLPQATGVTAGTMGAGLGIAAGAQPYQYDPTQLFTSQAASQYMSPYMQNVVDFQKSQALRDFNEQGAARAKAAVDAGAFGGSRQAIQEGMAERDLLDRMMGIQATGQQSAFENAQQAFQADRSALFGREQAQAAEDAAARQGQLAALGFAGQQAGELVRLGEAGRAADIQGAQLLETIGKSQLAREQEGLDTAYQDFLRQSAYPEQQLQFYSSILRGVPIEPSVTQTAYAPVNPLQQALGAGLSAIGLYRGLTA